MEKLNEIIKRVNNYWNSLWGWTDSQWRIIKKWKYWEVLAVIFLTISLILIFVFFTTLSKFLFPSENHNGELAKVLLSVFGGIGLFYGLFINSRRIKEQTRQNNIAEATYNDTRFNDAIKYLGSDDMTLNFAGFSYLKSIALVDISLRKTILEILSLYLKENSEKLYIKLNSNEIIKSNKDFDIIQVPLIVKSILRFIEDKIFYDYYKDLTNIYIANIVFNNDINKINFNNSKLVNCSFLKSIFKCKFYNVISYSCIFGTIQDSTIDDCLFCSSNFYKSKFYPLVFKNSIISLCKISCFFNAVEVINSKFFENKGSISISGSKNFDNVFIDDSTKSIKFNEKTLEIFKQNSSNIYIVRETK